MTPHGGLRLVVEWVATYIKKLVRSSLKIQIRVIPWERWDQSLYVIPEKQVGEAYVVRVPNDSSLFSNGVYYVIHAVTPNLDSNHGDVEESEEKAKELLENCYKQVFREFRVLAIGGASAAVSWFRPPPIYRKVGCTRENFSKMYN